MEIQGYNAGLKVYVCYVEESCLSKIGQQFHMGKKEFQMCKALLNLCNGYVSQIQNDVNSHSIECALEAGI